MGYSKKMGFAATAVQYAVAFREGISLWGIAKKWGLL